MKTNLQRFLPLCLIVFGICVFVGFVISSLVASDQSANKIVANKTPTVTELFYNFELPELQKDYFDFTTEQVGALLQNPESTIEGQVYVYVLAEQQVPMRLLGTRATAEGYVIYTPTQGAPLNRDLCPGGVKRIWAVVSYPIGNLQPRILAEVSTLDSSRFLGWDGGLSTMILQANLNTSTYLEVLSLEVPVEFGYSVEDVYVYAGYPDLVVWGVSIEYECSNISNDLTFYSPKVSYDDGLLMQVMRAGYGLDNVSPGQYIRLPNISIPFLATNFDLFERGTSLPSNADEIWILAVWPVGIIPQIQDSSGNPYSQEIIEQVVLPDQVLGVIHLENLSMYPTSKSYGVLGITRIFGITVRVK